jgi:hypothetical protein
MARFSTKELTKKYSKWSGYDTGYKSSSRSYGNSSFWMDDDFLTKESSTPGSKVDIVKLAGYKRAISNFVRIVTNKDNIRVTYSSGDSSYTDGETVVISSKLDEKEFDSTVGLALHEGSHIALTDFKLTRSALSTTGAYMKSLADYVTNVKGAPTMSWHDLSTKIKALVNIIEDRRIDKFVYDSAPGYQGYYQALYDKYFNAKEIDNALKSGKFNNLTWEDYEFHICNFANPNRTLDILPGLRDIWNTINIANISRLKSTQDVFNVATEVFKMIIDQISVAEQAETEQNESEETKGQGEAGDDVEEGGEGNGSSDDTNDKDTDPNMDIPAPSAKQSYKEQQEEKKLKDAIQKQKDFLNGDIKKKKLTKSEASKVNAAAESNMNPEEVGGDVLNDTGTVLSGRKTNCMVVKGVTKSLVDSGILGSHAISSNYYNARVEGGREDYIQDGIMLGIMLGKRLKTRDEERNLKTTRMETGRIDRRLIAELGFGNDRVFNQVIHNTVTPSIIHISIDASGSMDGDKWKAAIKTAVAVAKATSMVSSIDCIISVRGSYGDYDNQTPLMWVVYDSRKDKFANLKENLKMVRPTGSTPEGLCYQAVMKDIVSMANGKEAFFINICDGEPGYSDRNISYGGEYAIHHTATQVKKMNNAGIKTLAYFVSDSCSDSSWNYRSKEQFRRMYGTGSEFIDCNNLTQLSHSLNKLFIRK